MSLPTLSASDLNAFGSWGVRDGKGSSCGFSNKHKINTTFDSGEFEFGKDLICDPSCTLDLFVENMGRYFTMNMDRTGRAVQAVE